MTTPNLQSVIPPRRVWNRSRLIGHKRPLQPKHVGAIRVRLDLAENIRDHALFNFAIDSKLRGCDLISLLVSDVFVAGRVKERTSVFQCKTKQPVQFENTEDTRKSIYAWINHPSMTGFDFL